MSDIVLVQQLYQQDSINSLDLENDVDCCYDWVRVPGGVCLTNYKPQKPESIVFVPETCQADEELLVVEMENTFADNQDINVVVLPFTLNKLGDRVFSNCRNLTDVFLPDSMSSISTSAFDGCDKVTLHCNKEETAALCKPIASNNSGIDIKVDDPRHSYVRPDSWNADAMPEPDMMFPGMSADCDCAPAPMPEPDMCFPDMDCGYSPAPPMPAPAPSPSFTGHPQASKKESVKVTPVRCDKVSFSALSPEKVEKGTYSTISVFMYTKSQRKIVDKAIKAAKDSVAETTKGGFSVSRGSEVTVELCSDDVTVKDNRETREWNGSALTYDFMFLTPEDYSKKQIGFTCYVYFNGIQITRLNFAVGLRGDSKRVPVKVKRHDNRHVFVSYSHKDTQRVLAQLLGIQELAPKMTFWLDNQSLDTGDNWRNEIRRAINKADGLFLFWSVYSKASPEVENEWKYALKRKGLSFITPVPLDPPELCPPPAELGSRHFGHRSFHYSEDMDKLNFRNSKRVKIIK